MNAAGTRSVGKRLMGLEVVRTDGAHAGMLPGRMRSAMRNIYLPLALFGIFIPPFPQLAFLADFAATQANPTRKRLGDYLTKTAVVHELPERPRRTADFLAQLAQRDVDENVGKAHHARLPQTFGPLRVLPNEDIARMVHADAAAGRSGAWRRARIDEDTELSERRFVLKEFGFVGVDANDDQFFEGRFMHHQDQEDEEEAAAAAEVVEPAQLEGVDAEK